MPPLTVAVYMYLTDWCDRQSCITKERRRKKNSSWLSMMTMVGITASKKKKEEVFFPISTPVGRRTDAFPFAQAHTPPTPILVIAWKEILSSQLWRHASKAQVVSFWLCVFSGWQGRGGILIWWWEERNPIYFVTKTLLCNFMEDIDRRGFVSHWDGPHTPHATHCTSPSSLALDLPQHVWHPSG